MLATGHLKKCHKGGIVQALYATPPWACWFFFVEGGRCIKKMDGWGANFFIWRERGNKDKF